MILAFWLLDPGTIGFFVFLPRLLKEFWDTSYFTRILALEGVSGIQKATITLHNTGYYLVKKKWNRAKNDMGIIELGEPGTFKHNGDSFDLTSYCGLKRKLIRAGDDSYQVEEDLGNSSELANYSLQGWKFEALKPS